MRLNILSFSLLFFIYPGYGQNIVNNYSFEGSITGWETIKSVDHFYNNVNTACDGDESAPVTPGFVGLRFNHANPYYFEHNWQEYIFQKITGEMIAGIIYKVTFKYSLSDASQQTTDDIGIAFSDDYFFNENTEEKIQHTVPQVKNKEDNFITNYIGWETFTGFYTATGNEHYFSIGAFKVDSTIELIDVPNNYTCKMLDVYIFIDDVVITPCDDFPRVALIDDTVFCESGSVTLEASYPDASYLWSTGSTDSILVVEAVDGEKVYWVEITKNGCTYSDTVRIDLFLPSVSLGEDKIVCENNNFAYAFQVDKKVNENLVWENGSDKASRNITALGTYYVTKSHGECLWSDTISIYNFEEYASIYPNPVINDFHIFDTNNIQIDKIYSNQGALLWQNNVSSITVDELIIKLNPAVYFVILKGYGCEKVIKFEKSH